MNQYEKLFNDILIKTEADIIKWTQIGQNDNSNLIFNYTLVWRQYSAIYVKESGDTYRLLLVQKKFDDPEYDNLYEGVSIEILIVNAYKELILSINESIIERSDLFKLLRLVETRNEDVKNLFKF